MPTSTLTTLGGFALTVNGISAQSPSTRKARALLAYLIMHRNADTARERLLDIFWPNADPERARDSLKTALWSIRRCLRKADVDPDDFVLTTRSMVHWNGDTIVDAQEFAQLAGQDDLQSNQEALQIYRGDFLEGDYDNWAVEERERLATLYESVLAKVIRSSKDPYAAQQLVARNPYDEEAYAALIETELGAGRRSSAASWVQRCRSSLAEVGEKPSAAFEARFGAIAQIDAPLADGVDLPFAGRATELARLSATIADASAGRGSITLVYGEAGIGKSTLLDRAAHIAAEKGLRVLSIGCASEVPNTFGPWEAVFRELPGALPDTDFDSIVRAHASDLATAVAGAIAVRLSAPTMLVVDDAHELNAAALDIFASLAQQAYQTHAIIVASRPEGLSILRSRLEETTLEELPIGCLDRNDLRWALTRALGGDLPELLDVLYARTGGHPLFFRGLLQSLVNAGALTRDGNRWHLSKPIDANIDLPDTVKRFIETRLRARGDTPSTVAGALALEPAANADDLIAVLHLDESTVLDALDDLLALGLIEQPVSGTQFAFCHELIREVAAASLNAGRRASLHRAFAQRLNGSGQLEASLRVAQHFAAYGDFLLAADSFLKAAREALGLNAAQEAIDRCEAGVLAAEKLGRTAARDLLIANLNATAARAAMAAGDATDAVTRAHQAVRLARAAGDVHALTRALLDLSAMNGPAYRLQEQRADAMEAAHHAQLLGDQALEAQALVQQACAERELGNRDEALHSCASARKLAVISNRLDVAQMTVEELLRVQTMWWLFGEALETARRGLDGARRAEPLVEGAFLLARSSLWYLLERFDEAKSDIQAALLSTDRALSSAVSFDAAVHPLPLLQFDCHYMAAKVAITQKDWDRALEAAEKAAALTNVAKLPQHDEALSLLRIDVSLQRNDPDDVGTVLALASRFDGSSRARGTLGWSDCTELARARVAARYRMQDAEVLLRRALHVLEENAHQVPLEADRAFARLAEAASDLGNTIVAARAQGRSAYYKSRRIASAGVAWGGRTTTEAK